MSREIERLPNFKFSKRMCTSLMSQPWLGHQIRYNPYSGFRKCIGFNKRKCQSLGSLNRKRRNGTDFIFNNDPRNVWQERLMNFTAESSSLDSVLDSESISNQFEFQRYDDKNRNAGRKRYNTPESLDESSSSSVPMPYTLQRIFAAPSIDSSRRHIFDELSLDIPNENILDFTPTVDISRKNHSGRTFQTRLSSIPKHNNGSNISTISSSCSLPSLLEMFDRRSSSPQGESERSSHMERRFSDSDSSNSVIPPLSNANPHGDGWYYYDLRMRPGTSFQVSSIADTLLEFFRQFHRSVVPATPPSYDSSVAVDISSSNTSSSILVPVESAMDLLSGDRDVTFPSNRSEFCSPPPYTEYDEPPAYEEIDIHDYQNTYEVIDTSANIEVTTDLINHDPLMDQMDHLLEPPFVPHAGVDFNFGLSGRPAVRWNVQSRVEKWVTASRLGWNQI